MGLVDYHIHTSLCGHASGSPEDYIRAAVQSGIMEIGFADHAPLPEGQREGITMRSADTEAYIRLIEEARAENNGRIAVKIGFEVDFPFQESFDRRYLGDPRLDFLIGSCHIMDGWMFDNPHCVKEFEHRDINKVYTRYFELLLDLVSSGAFNIVGHLDLVKKFGHRPTRDFSEQIRMLARECSRRGVAVEVNTAGLRKPVGEIYPSDDILSVLFDENVPVTMGSDAHAPEEVAYEYAAALGRIKAAGYDTVSGFSRRVRYDISV